MFWTIVDLMASLEAILGAAVFFSTVAEIPGERLKLGGGGGERTVRCPSCHRDSDLLRPLSAGADYDEPRPRFATLKEVLVDGGEAMVALRGGHAQRLAVLLVRYRVGQAGQAVFRFLAQGSRRMNDDPEYGQGGEADRPGFADNYRRGLHSSAVGNAAAYGYSVTITATFGILSTTRGIPGAPEILAFVVGAVVAVALVEALASGGFRHEIEDEPSTVRALGSSISVTSVGGSLGIVFAAERLLGGFAIWPLGSLLATSSYLFAYALEIAVADRIRRRHSNGASER